MKDELKQFRIVFFCFFVIIMTSNLKAQEEGSGESKSSMNNIEYGIKVGAVYHNFTNLPPHTSGKMGFTAGIFGTYPFSDLIAVQLDLAYFQQGGKYIMFKDDTRFGVTESFVSKNVKDASVTLHNVYVPLQAKLNLFSQSYLPKILIGPYMDFNFYATESYQRTGEIEDNIYGTAIGNDVVTDQYEQFQFGVMAGLEFQIKTGSSWDMLFGVSYKYGLTPAKKSFSYIDYFAVSEDLYTNALSMTLGIKF
jgi:hypothetical protein